MATDVEASCKILTDERIKQLLLSLQGTQHTEIESEPSENVNKEKMVTYASVVSNERYNKTRHNEQPTSTDTHTQDAQRNPSDFVKPIFLKDQDVHGSVKPPRSQWLTNAEIYMAIGSKVPSE
jgi:hypothetical protein